MKWTINATEADTKIDIVCEVDLNKYKFTKEKIIYVTYITPLEAVILF